MRPIAIYGTGGVGREVACLINQINAVTPRWEMIGFFDDFLPAGGIVLGNTDTINAWDSELDLVLAFSNPHGKHELFSKIHNPLISFPNIVAPSAQMFDPAAIKMGHGNIVHPGCLLSCNVCLGSFNFMNYMVTIGHDTNIGSFNCFMPMVNISGGVTIGSETFWGMKSGIAQQLTVGDKSIVGAGAILLGDARSQTFYTGVPASPHPSHKTMEETKDWPKG